MESLIDNKNLNKGNLHISIEKRNEDEKFLRNIGYFVKCYECRNKEGLLQAKNINPKFFEKYPFNIPELAVEMPKVDKLYGSCAEHAGVTAQGYLRDAQAYWMAVYNRCPKAFSEANLIKMFNPIRKVIKNNNFHSPVNDKTFRNSFPQYDIQGIRGNTLYHHHVGGRGQAIPVPRELHKGSGDIHKDEEKYGILYKRGGT